MLLRSFIAVMILLAGTALGVAQGPPPNPSRIQVNTGAVGAPPNYQDASAANPLPVSASVSASISGFAPATTGTPITASVGGATGTLPAGTVVVAFNAGTTNTAFCKLGAASTTSDIAIPPQSWFAYTVGAATQLTCVTSTSTTTVNMIGGAGLPTGAGGGGGGGGSGGAVTIIDGGDVAEGATADAACATDNGACSMVALTKRNNQRLTTLNTTLGSPFQAGGSIGNTAFAATQSGPWALSVSNTGTFAVQASQVGAPWSVSLTATTVAAVQSGTWNVGSSPNTANSWAIAAGGAAIPTNNVLMGMSISGTLSPVTGTGNSLNVNCTGGCSGGSAAASPTFGLSLPTTATVIGFSQGGVFSPVTGTSGNLNVNCQVGCSASGLTPPTFGQSTPSTATMLGISLSGTFTPVVAALYGNLATAPTEPPEQTASCAAACNGTDLIPATNVSGMAGISMIATYAGTSTPQFQFSEDAAFANFTIANCSQVSATAAIPAQDLSFAGSGPYWCPAAGKYFRLRYTAYTSGTTSLTWAVKAVPYSQPITTVTGSTGAIFNTNPSTASNWAIGTIGSALTTRAVTMGMSVSGTFTPLSGTGNNLNVNCIVGCSGSAGQAAPTFTQSQPSTGTIVGMSVSGTFTPLSGTGNNLNVNCAAGCSTTSDLGYGPLSLSSAASFTAVDLNGYGSFSFSFTAIGSGNTIIPEDSDDNATWIQASVINRSNVGQATSGLVVSFNPSLTTGYVYAKRSRYFRLRISVFSTGPVTVVGNSMAAISQTQPVVSIGNSPTVTATPAVNPVSTMNSASASGSLTAAVAGVFDDISPTTCTENNFCYVRQSADRQQYMIPQGAAPALGTAGSFVQTISFSAVNATYSANTAMADSGPTAGGFTISNACRTTGASSLLTDMDILDFNPASTSLQGEVWLFDSSVTAISNGSAFSVSDGDMQKRLGKVPFTLATEAVVNASASVAGINMTVTCNGTANLRYLVKVVNANGTPYTSSSDTLTIRPKFQWLNYLFLGLGGIRRRRPVNDNKREDRIAA